MVGVPIITEQRGPLLPQGPAEGRPERPAKTLEELEAAAAKDQGRHTGHRRLRGPHRQVRRRHPVLQLPVQLRRRLRGRRGKSAVNSDAAKQAYAYYGGLIRNYGPANVSTDMSWPEAMAIFTQGKAAFYTEADSLYKNATDPAKSKVADTVGFAAFPAGPAGSKPYNIPSWALGVNEASGNKDNAWKFIQWATSKEHTLAQQKAGVPEPRTSVWSDPAGTSTYPEDLAEAIAASTKNGVGHDRPEVVKVGKAREIVGGPIVDDHHRRGRLRLRRHGPRGLPEVPGQRKEVARPARRRQCSPPGGAAARPPPRPASSSLHPRL